MREKIASLRNLAPIFLVFFIVIGGIYAGLFTPTEASAIGVVGVLLIGGVMGRIRREGLLLAVRDTVMTTGMIFVIIFGGHIIARFFVLTEITVSIINWLTGTGMSPHAILFAFILMYLFLGAILDVYGMLILTLPFTFPVMMQLGFDPVWFGIFVVMMTELALITPPVGINVYVMKAIVPEVPLMHIFAGVFPFVLAIFVLLFILILFPGIVTFLPSVMM